MSLLLVPIILSVCRYLTAVQCSTSTIWCDDMSNYTATGWTGSGLSTSTSAYCANPPCLFVIQGSTATKLNIPTSHWSGIKLSYDIRWYDALDSYEYIYVRYSCSGGSPNTLITYYYSSHGYNIMYSPVLTLPSACDFVSTISLSFQIVASMEDFYLDNVCLTGTTAQPTLATYPPSLQPTSSPFETIFYDSMDNAIVTGWSFDGSYLAPINSANCPNGGFCTELEGGCTMYRTFTNISSLSSLQLKYDMKCADDCYVCYKYDNHDNYITVRSDSSGGTYLNDQHSLHAQMGSDYLAVKFVAKMTTGSWGSEDDVWVDNFYLTESATATTTQSKFIIYYDSMDNAVVTGWLFGGSYLAPTNSANCPNGGFCTELSGSASTYRTFLNVTTLSSLQIRYDIRCGYCYVDYKYDNHAEFIRVFSRSTSYGTFLHNSHSLFNAPTAATNLTVRFVSYNNYKTWIDNFYFNATKNTSTMYAPSVLFYDSMDNTIVTQWLFSGSYLTPTYSTSCPGGAFCTAIYGSSAKMYRTFLNIHDGLHSLQFQFDITCRYCYVDYKYDNHVNYITLFSRSASSYGTFKQQLSTLHAPTGARNVTVRFVSSSVGYYVWIENFYFDAYTLTPTNAPSSPTETPTSAPSSVSQHPSFYPTSDPSLSPTQYPTISPSSSPTIYPTSVTQSPTLIPTVAPSFIPTLATHQPSPSPTNIPTQPPTLSTIIFYDSMDNAIVTGWSFNGSYLAPTNSANCPNGGFCTQLYSTPSSMYRTFTDIHGLQSLQIQYDIRCAYCYVQYKYDNHVNYITLYSRSYSSYATTKKKLHALHRPTGATTLIVRFVVSRSGYYVQIDNFYFNAEPAVTKTYAPPIIYYDSMDNAVVTGWLFDGSYLAPTNSANCPNGGFCTELSGKMSRTFSDIRGFHSLEFQFDIRCYRCYIDYKYDNHDNYIKLFNIYGSSYYTYKQNSYTLHAPNEATDVTVRFVSEAGYAYVDNFYFNASTDAPTTTPSFIPSSITYSPTATPTYTPTLAPTIAPTYLTMEPSSSPSYAPTFPPSLHPSSSPTSPPTLQPTYSPTFTPTNTPTLFPSNAPSLFPTDAPSQTPTMHTNTPSNMPSDSPTTTPSFSPSSITYSPTATPTSTPTLAPTISPTYLTTAPSSSPSYAPTISPSLYPSSSPTSPPTLQPTYSPTFTPTNTPTMRTNAPTKYPTQTPSVGPTINPSNNPSKYPSVAPTVTTSNPSTMNPTNNPSQNPTTNPTTSQPTEYDTKDEQANANIENYVEKIVIILAIMLTLCGVGVAALLLKMYKSKTANSSSTSLLDIKVKTQVEMAMAMAMAKQRLDEGKREDNDDIEDINIYTKEKQLPIPTAPVLHNGEIERKYENKSKHLEKGNDIAISSWSKEDIIEWVNNINLKEQWKQVALNAFENGEYNGNDLMRAKSGKDIAKLFAIQNPMLCNRLWKDLKKRK